MCTLESYIETVTMKKILGNMILSPVCIVDQTEHGNQKWTARKAETERLKEFKRGLVIKIDDV